MPIAQITHFADVDRTKDPGFFPRFLDEATKVPVIGQSKQMLLERLRLRRGDHGLDVGCGTGEDVFELARHVGETGNATGVDASAAMIEEAKRRAESRHIPAVFKVADSQALPFATATFDGVRTDRMLMHVPDAECAVSEICRVLKTGGRVAAFDFDHDTIFCDSPFKETTRKIARTFSDSLKSGSIGSKLPRLFQANAIVDISVNPLIAMIHYEFAQLLLGGHVANLHAEGALSAGEADEWWTALAQASREGTFTCGLTAFVVSGVKR